MLLTYTCGPVTRAQAITLYDLFNEST